MGRYETIGTVIEMQRMYNAAIATAMRVKYYNENIRTPGRAMHKRLIENSCALAEQTSRLHMSQEDIWHAMVYFGVCLDCVKYKLDWQQCEKDMEIKDIRERVDRHYLKKIEETQYLLEQAKLLIDEETLADIRTGYRKEDAGNEKVISDVWQKKLIGQARTLAQAVINNGGTSDEIVQALTYFQVCIDVNKYQLDDMRYRHENGIVELARKYGVKSF